MVEQYISSFIEGRVRLRHPFLKEAEAEGSVKEVLEKIPGVLGVNVNTRSGSLLLEYDPETLSKEDLLGMADNFIQSMPPVPEKKASPFLKRAQCIRLANRSMVVTLGASLAFAVMGRTAPHIWAGGVFCALNLAHLYRVRKCL